MQAPNLRLLWREYNATATDQISSGISTATISGLFETHLNVRNLDVLIRFCEEVVGLELAYRMEERGVAFLWTGAHVYVVSSLRGCSH